MIISVCTACGCCATNMAVGPSAPPITPTLAFSGRSITGQTPSISSTSALSTASASAAKRQGLFRHVYGDICVFSSCAACFGVPSA